MSSDFLFARPTLLTGAARVLDLWGVFDEYNESATPAQADARAIFSDWRITGQDLVGALDIAQRDAAAAAAEGVHDEAEEQA
jgi:hypothetical protein